ncbi:MAG: TlpA family protein disulfide reductase [Candidatus Sungiibacteriota bacterium]|uniref:TlpA family protein disulfide reductase n=1 Tax=Candidatus Sungiibacteriota bacterium TaxID=2750080 RepID=A0A7T5RJ62_9BACT|nr:MAG: TlpA family protein disulfide reductase [Candidatus Sungbacteria bacterium]
MSTKNIIFLVVVILAAAGLAGLFLVQRGVINPPSPQTNKAAPEFSFNDYNGKEVKLSDFRGKPILVNAWAAWCPFCREELSDFAKVKEEFGGKFEVIAIDRAEPLEVAKRYSDQLGVTEKFVFLLDPADSFYQSIGGFSMPETIFVDKDGKTVFHKRGPMKQEEIRRRIQENFNL